MAATGSGEMVSPTHKCGKAAEISVRLQVCSGYRVVAHEFNVREPTNVLNKVSLKANTHKTKLGGNQLTKT